MLKSLKEQIVMSSKNEITAVLAANKNLELTRNWYEDFRQRFPEQQLAIGCIGGDQDISNYIKSIASPVTTVFVGSPLDEHDVSFSECYNAAINLVKTEKLVLIHNDMQFCENFFDVISNQLDTVGHNFVGYITFEPPVFIHHKRDGKIIREWKGWDQFNEWSKEIQSNTDPLPEASTGFFRAGWTSDFHKVGGFDQQSFKVFCEDDDFVLRCALSGFKVFQSSHACSYHFVSQTSNTADRRQRELQSTRKFTEKWGIEPFQVYPVQQAVRIIEASRNQIRSSFEVPEPNYLDIQKVTNYII